MAFWRRVTSPDRSDGPERLPPVQRISLPSADRLATITESGNPPSTPPIPRRSSLRNSAQRGQAGLPRPWSLSSTSARSTRTAPPTYDWVPEALDEKEDSNAPVEGEQLARLRKGEGWRRERRGGWARVLLITGLVLLAVIALAVGLGVGLRHKHGPTPDSPTPEVTQRFPVGQYSFVTALETVETTCTANPETWSCWPFITYAQDSSTASQAAFNWIITNTSSSYATTESTPSTPVDGVPANLTVRSTNNPFGITFTGKPLTYIASASNSSSAQYTFSFTMPKTVVPTVALTPDGSTSECFFNQTVFSATMYLSAKGDYSPSGSTSAGSFEQWPFAVDITQTAIAGQDGPNCYETHDGAIGAQVTYGLDMQPAGSQCLCEYRNY